MGKISYKKLKGSQSLRQRLLLATLSSTPVLIEDIRADDMIPGLRPHEVSLLHLFEKVSDDCLVEINETGSKFKYKPGIVVGGRNLVHDCGTSRSIGYFLEPLIVLGLFAKKPLSIRLKGITNDSKDPCVDTFCSTTLPMLKKFGVPSDGLKLKIESRGAPPRGGGEVILSMPIVQCLTAVTWVDEGMVKRIRGQTFSARVSAQFENTMLHAARGIFNNLLADVHIFTDHKAGREAGNSPGYGISLVAETTTGCFFSADTAVSYARGDDVGEMDDEEKKEMMPPEDVGEQIASFLLQEIEQGGVVDSTHQCLSCIFQPLIQSSSGDIIIEGCEKRLISLKSRFVKAGNYPLPACISFPENYPIRGLLFLLCALCPQDVSKVRVGKLSPYGIETLRHIRDFLGVKFVIKPDPSTGTVILKCVGSGLKNLSRKSS